MGWIIGRHRYLLSIFLVITAGWIWLVVKKSKRVVNIHSLMNVIGVVLVILPTYKLISSLLIQDVDASGGNAQESALLHSESDAIRPDIYYIILDGYARQDVLTELYSYDNSEMLEWLESHGFFIANASHSNYMQTLLSLASSLNMDYLSDFNGWEEKTRNDLNVFNGLIRHSKVREELSRQGYEMISFETGYNPTNIRDADIFLSVEDVSRAGDRYILIVNEFEDMLINSTLASIFYDPVIIERFFGNVIMEDPIARHKNRIQFTFSQLAEIPTRQGDYFVFAHIISPHPPFIFDENGAAIRPEGTYTFYDASNYPGTKEEYIQRYRQQLIYLNTLIMETVEMILSQSEIDPIIILQADHGPGAYLQTNSLESSNLKERFSILNAYHFPLQGDDVLNKNITPVNSFRLLFNRYFDASYEILDDEMYFATWRRPFRYINVTKNLVQ
jgi:hypothetical protein